VQEDTRRGSPWLLAFLLTACLTVAYMDRAILNLLAQPIKQDLQLSDTRLSLLQGVAFTLSFTLATLPAGWLADRMDRRLLITVGMVAWSLMTAACGLASTFEELFLARVGVGLFEAVLTPCAVIMIAAAIPPASRGTAMGLYHTGTVLGVGLSLLIGGLLIERLAPLPPLDLPLVGALEDWQVTFVALSIPGLVLALIFFLLARDDGPRATEAGAPRAVQPLRSFFRERGTLFAAHALAMTLLLAAVAAGTAWGPVFMIREWGFAPGQVARTLGPISILFGLIGIFAGGWLASFLARRGSRNGPLIATLFSAVGATAAGILVYQTEAGPVGYLGLAAVTLFSPMPFGVALAVLADLARPEVRGRVTALYIFTLNALGQSLGPLAVGLSNDRIFGSDQALATSLSLVWAVCGGLAILILLWARPRYRAAVTTAE
jgi:MFS family permease